MSRNSMPRRRPIGSVDVGAVDTASVEHPARADLLHAAVVYSVASVGWGLLSGVAGVVFGILAHSVALTAFGLGASIDSLASLVLVRRFELERREPHRA